VFEGAGLDGVVAKPKDLPYREDERVMFKVKHERTADCVVAGFRWHKTGPVVGSLLLGLYDEEQRLQHVGVSASFSMERRRELLDELAPYRLPEGAEHPWTGHSTPERVPGAMVSRWNAKKDLTFELLKPELVVEVAYDHMEGRRFRHTAQFRRWRYDRDPPSCTYAQIERPVEFDLGDILAGRGLPDSSAS
jgi:ATP-dependent DNA ligase